jgi:hypothetical protein
MARNKDPQPGVSRRGFLVTMGSFVLGSFFLPELEAEEGEGVSVLPESREEQRIRKLIEAPVWSSGKDVMIWVEENPHGQPQTMV